MPLHDLNSEDVRTAAYYKWESAGCPLGDGQEFWLAAERECIEAASLVVREEELGLIDEASRESFPASDPPAWIPSSVSSSTRDKRPSAPVEKPGAAPAGRKKTRARQ